MTAKDMTKGKVVYAPATPTRTSWYCSFGLRVASKRASTISGACSLTALTV